MRKVIATMAVLAASVTLSGALHANFTVFDLAKDSMYIARGEFSSLERTASGDRLTLRCDTVIKGDLQTGAEVSLEAFEPAHADDALGRDVIVCFNLVDGKHYFVNHPIAYRSFMFETDDAAPNGLNQNEQAIRNFLAINAPHQEAILQQLRKRLQLKQLGYMGRFDADLVDQWRDELLKQTAWAGTRAARDAAKALVEHELFKGSLTVPQVRMVADRLSASQVGSIERAYMLELVRNFPETHPELAVLLNMLRQETSQACVGKLSSLMSQVENREGVLAAVGEMATNTGYGSQTRVNALQMLQALKDTDGLPYVHAAVLGELERSDWDKDVLRRAFKAMRDTPDAGSTVVLDTCLEHPVVTESRELTQLAWIAYAMIDSTETNTTLRGRYKSAENEVNKRFFQRLLPENKILRKLIIVHKED
jgi:hypothetical protein